MSLESTSNVAGGELVAVYPAKALDVSEYQGRVDWRQVHAAGYHHAAAKATEGVAETDNYVKRNAEHARAAGVKLSLYHFAHPSQSARKQARHFLDVAIPLVRVGDPCPVLDLEVTEGLSPLQLWRFQHEWCSIVGEAFGTHVALYSYLYFLAHDLYLPPHHRPIWGAAYGHVPSSILAGWHAWQHSSSGRVPGISGRVDLDSIRKPLPLIGRKP